MICRVLVLLIFINTEYKQLNMIGLQDLDQEVHIDIRIAKRWQAIPYPFDLVWGTG
jgi:hypothetical protein